jgi:hypothetical protein
MYFPVVVSITLAQLILHYYEVASSSLALATAPSEALCEGGLFLLREFNENFKYALHSKYTQFNLYIEMENP